MDLIENCPRNSKIALKFKYTKGSWVIDKKKKKNNRFDP